MSQNYNRIGHFIIFYTKECTISNHEMQTPHLMVNTCVITQRAWPKGGIQRRLIFSIIIFINDHKFYKINAKQRSNCSRANSGKNINLYKSSNEIMRFK